MTEQRCKAVLADRSLSCPHQMDPAAEVAMLEARGSIHSTPDRVKGACGVAGAMASGHP